MKKSSRATRARAEQRINAHEYGEVVRGALRLTRGPGNSAAATARRHREGLDNGAGRPWEAQEAKRQARAHRAAKLAVKTQIARLLRRPRAAEDVAEIWGYIADRTAGLDP